MVTEQEYFMARADEVMKKYGCPFYAVHDYIRLDDNKRLNKPLCDHCEGTGNELLSMYRKCPKCNGTGVQQTQD